MKYEDIVETWFFRRVPKGMTFETYEEQPGLADREKTAKVFDKMRREFPITLERHFFSDYIPPSTEGVALIDKLLTPKRADEWISHSDPEDPNNFFKLTVSEFAVYFGDAAVAVLGGAWKHARMPNFSDSIVKISDLDLFVFDVMMKKCSEDFGHERLVHKWKAFDAIVNERRRMRKDLPH